MINFINQKWEKKNIVRRIDHSKIKDGWILFIGGVYDEKGNYLHEVPYVEKTEEEVEKEVKEKVKQNRRIDVSEFSETKENKAKPLLVADILNLKFSEEPFLVEKLTPLKSLSALSGYPESGKGWIILELARSVASGTPFLSKYQTQQGNVLIIDEEAGEQELQRRMKLLKFDPNLPIYFLSQKGFKVDNQEGLEYLLKITRQKQIKLVIFDPFVAVHSKKENEAQEMQKVMEALQKFTLEGATVIFVHHHRKQLGWGITTSSQSLRGSSVLFGRVDSHLTVEKKSETKEEMVLLITQEKSRKGKKIAPFQIRLTESIEGEELKLEYIGEYKEREKKIEKAKEVIRVILGEEALSRKEVLEKIKTIAGQRARSEAFSEMKESEEIKQTSEKKIIGLNGKRRKVPTYKLFPLEKKIRLEE